MRLAADQGKPAQACLSLPLNKGAALKTFSRLEHSEARHFSVAKTHLPWISDIHTQSAGKIDLP
jgi:hypothetical protein